MGNGAMREREREEDITDKQIWQIECQRDGKKGEKVYGWGGGGGVGKEETYKKEKIWDKNG